MSDNNDQKSDVLSNVQGQMRLSERIAAFIPGFHGYKEKEIRRESDRLIRNHLYMKLTIAKTSVEKLTRNWLTDATLTCSPTWTVYLPRWTAS